MDRSIENGVTVSNYDHDPLGRRVQKDLAKSTKTKRTTYSYNLANELLNVKNFVVSNPPGGRGCFLAGTMITMADGTKKPIERIKKGDEVLAFDEGTKTLKPDKVVHVFHHPKEDFYLVINGHMRVTPIHPVLSKGEWVEVGKLGIGDTLTGADGQDIVIASIKEVHESVEIYNFEVNPLHTYIADGIIVHNRKLPMEQAPPPYGALPSKGNSSVVSRQPSADSWKLIANNSLWSIIDSLWSAKEAQAQAALLNSQFTYTYDLVGNRLSMNAPNGLHNYTYNNIYELTNVTGAQTHSFAYDNVANRVTADGVSYAPNNLNQYTSVGVTNYTYDNNGNLTYDGVNTYAYDIENRLTTAMGTNNSSYEYDGLGRRISKTVNGAKTYFVYDGDRVIEERDASGVLLKDYVYGDGIDEILIATSNQRQATDFYFYDGLGSVTDITDVNGNLIENYSYDVYGNPSIQSSIGNRYMFTGREYDAETGLIHSRARTLNPNIGRFQQRDSLGNIDSENLYQYALNSPINYADPYGQNVWDLVDVGFFLDSAKKFSECRNFKTGLNLAFDTFSLLPIVPSLGYITRVDDVVDLMKASKNVPSAKAPVGRKGSPFDVKPGTNTSAMIGGRNYSGHALDRIQGRGLTPSVIENTIKTGKQSPGNKSGRVVHHDSINSVSVVTDKITGDVITVRFGAP